jgi:DNA repair exonuclease SbcCD ATPase subunit
MSYKITYLRVFNFKVFDDFELDFKKSNIITLGGPNGYGKTSIFDAIELALTENIERFIPVDKATGSTDNIIGKDGKDSVAIKLELSNGSDTITVRREFNKINNTKQINKVNNFKNVWKTTILRNNIEESNSSQQRLEELLGEQNLAKYYNSFFYIQQEDTAHFLRKDEQARLNLIAQLFDIKKETDELQKLKELDNKLKQIHKQSNEEKQKITQGDLTQKTLSDENIEYGRLINFTNSIEHEWDKEQLTFREADTKDKYFHELKRIHTFVENKDNVIKFFQTSYVKQSIEKIKNLVALYNIIEKQEIITQLAKDKPLIQKILIDLENIELILEQKINFEVLKTKIDFDFDAFRKEVTTIKSLKDNLSKSDKVIRELLAFRENLITKFNESLLDKNNCPLCGFDWGNADALILAIDEKKIFLNTLIESDTKIFNEKVESLKPKLKILKDLITNLIQDQYEISNEYVEYINKYKESISFVLNFSRFFVQNEIFIDDLIIKDLNTPITEDMLLDLANKVIERIDSKIIFSEEFLNNQYEFRLVDVYQTYFDRKEENIQNITVEDIRQKEKYIQQMYYKFNQSKYKRLQILTKEISEIENIIKNIDTLVKIYVDKISKHRRKMIQNIELAFYIYSGKILQNIRGNQTSGIFMKDAVRGNDDKLNNIRFVADYASDQDIVNTTSSGQLAGIVIALTLALNRIYSKNLDSLMIDDPVQSMDDINMISLVELLRNDFKDKQIFLSTHEDEIEKYILYKYMKHQYDVCRVDVMKQKIYYKKQETEN